MVDLGFELRDYETARQLFWESEIFNDVQNINKGTSSALYRTGANAEAPSESET